MPETWLFVAHGFTRENLRLQPWRYLFEIATRLAETRRVVVITRSTDDRESTEEWDEGIRVLKTCYLRPNRQRELGQLIASIEPRTVVWSFTPRSIVYTPLFRRLGCDLRALFTSPLYRVGEMARATRLGADFEHTRGLWAQSLVPRFLLRRTLGKKYFRRVYTQSEANRQALVDAGVCGDKVKVIPVGHDTAETASPLPESDVGRTLGFQSDGTGFLYLGASSALRGFEVLMKAFAGLVRRNDAARLCILARGADEQRSLAIRRDLHQLGIERHVKVLGGWCSEEEIASFMLASSAVVLPFLLVPSDVPIAVLEGMAQGCPVIASRIDGIPELIEGRGYSVTPGDVDELTAAMLRVCEDRDSSRLLGSAGREFMESYPDWNAVARRMLTDCVGTNS